MLTVIQRRGFKKTFKKLLKSGSFNDTEFDKVISYLIVNEKLPAKYKDHVLSGNMVGYRECHLDFDFLLLYEIDESSNILTLVDIGSHSELFG